MAMTYQQPPSGNDAAQTAKSRRIVRVMASANGSGEDRREEDVDPERTQRMPATKGVVERWFSGRSDDEEQQSGGGR